MDVQYRNVGALHSIRVNERHYPNRDAAVADYQEQARLMEAAALTLMGADQSWLSMVITSLGDGYVWASGVPAEFAEWLAQQGLLLRVG